MEGLEDDPLRATLRVLEDPVGFLCALFANAPVGLQIYRADGTCLLTNRAFQDLFGSTPPPEYNVLKDDIAERRGILESIRRAFGGELVTTPPVWYDPRELRQVPVTAGRRVAVSATFFPLGNHPGSVDFVGVTFRDHTAEMEARERLEGERDRLRASEAALRAEEERFRRLADNAPDMIFRYRFVPSPGFEYVSRAAEAITGYRPEEFLADPDLLVRITHTEDREVVLGLHGGRLPGGMFTVRLGHRAGRTVWTEQRVVPVLDPRGDVAGFEGVSRDVTERMSLEEQLRQSQKVEALGRLSGGIAHDFNNILTVILGCATLIRDDLGQDAPLRQDLDEIVQAANRASQLTQQLLAFGRRQILSPRVINLNAVIQSMQTMLRRLIGEDVDLRVALDPALGNVRADAGQVEQILVNLVVNAREAMPRGGKLHIETGNVVLDAAYAARHLGVEPGPYAMLAIADTGNGMDEYTRAHLFEPFFTTKKDKGTGLGLATVYGIVKQSGGNIWVYSEPGVGTTFKVYLPLVEAPLDPAWPPPRPSATLMGDETVVLAEDEASVRQLAARVLREHGYHVLEAATGADALRVSESHPGSVHLLITDVVMPRMSGRELAEWMQRKRQNIRVLYLSGYTADAIVHHGVLEPGLAFLQKPFSPPALLQKVREVLDTGPGGRVT